MCKQCKNNNKDVGQLSERLAAKYLRQHKYKILKTNVSYPWGEIDIVAKDHNNTLVFIEVKSLNKERCLGDYNLGMRPEDNLTRPKLSKLIKACSFFANDNPELARNGWRIDLVALTISNKGCDIRHLENIG